MKKKSIIIIIIGVIILGLIIGYISTLKMAPSNYNPNSNIKTSENTNQSSINTNQSSINTISPSESYSICTQESCPSENYWIEGYFNGSNLTDKSSQFNSLNVTNFHSIKAIIVESYFNSLIDEINFMEKMKLEKNGIVKARIKGRLEYNTQLFCTNDSCEEAIVMYSDPNESIFIAEESCPFDNNCFDNSDRIMSLKEAYLTIASSNICNSSLRQKPAGYSYFEYNDQDNYWRVKMNNPPGGGQVQFCRVYKDKVQLYGNTSKLISEENNVSVKTLNDLYSECISENPDHKNVCQHYYQKSI